MQTAIASEFVNSIEEYVWPPSEVAADWFAEYLPVDRQAGHILSLASGDGRAARIALRMGYKVYVVDSEVGSLMDLSTGHPVVIVRADLITRPWPFPTGYFSAAIVSRPLPSQVLDAAMASIKPGGTLVLDFDEHVPMIPSEKMGMAGGQMAPNPPGSTAGWNAGRFEALASEGAFATHANVGLSHRIVTRKPAHPPQFEGADQPPMQSAML